MLTYGLMDMFSQCMSPRPLSLFTQNIYDPFKGAANIYEAIQVKYPCKPYCFPKKGSPAKQALLASDF